MKKDTYELRKNSALFWFTLLIPVGIIGIGVNFILNPIGASAGYGIPIHDPAAFPFMWIKGIRDIFSGLVILPFLFSGNRKVTAILFGIAIFVPFSDGLVIISHSGFAAPWRAAVRGSRWVPGAALPAATAFIRPAATAPSVFGWWFNKS